MRGARCIAGPAMPIHVFGAGDPLELPFLVFLGADIFDSASYGRYALEGWYMTIYGAINSPDRLIAGEYRCGCHICTAASNPAAIFKDRCALASHNLWTILDTIKRIRLALEGNVLPAMLAQVLKRHMEWFPTSELAQSWESLHV